MARLACTTVLLLLLFTAKIALSYTPQDDNDKQLEATSTAAIHSIRTSQTATDFESPPPVSTSPAQGTYVTTKGNPDWTNSNISVQERMKMQRLLSPSTTDPATNIAGSLTGFAHSFTGATTDTPMDTNSVNNGHAHTHESTSFAAQQPLKRKRMAGPVEPTVESKTHFSTTATSPSIPSTAKLSIARSDSLLPRDIAPTPQLPLDFSRRDSTINESWLVSYSSSPAGLKFLKSNLSVMISGRHVASLFSAVGLLLKYSPTYDDILKEVFKVLQSKRDMQIYTQLCLAYRNEAEKLSLLLFAELHAQSRMELAIIFLPLYILHPAKTLEFYSNFISKTIAQWSDAEFARYVFTIGDLASTQSFMEIMIVNLAKAHKATFVLQAAQKMTDASRRNQLVSSCIYFAAVNDCFSCMQAYKSYLPNVDFGTFDVGNLLRELCYITTHTSVFQTPDPSCLPSDAPCIPLVTGLDISNEVRSAIDGNVGDQYKSALGQGFVWSAAEFERQTMYALSRGSFSILEHIFSLKETCVCSNSVATAKALFIHCLKLKIYGRSVISLRFTHNPLIWLLDSVRSSESWDAHYQEIVQSATEEIYRTQPELKPALNNVLKRYSVLRDALKEPAASESRRVLMAEILREVQMAPVESAHTTTKN